MGHPLFSSSSQKLLRSGAICTLQVTSSTFLFLKYNERQLSSGQQCEKNRANSPTVSAVFRKKGESKANGKAVLCRGRLRGGMANKSSVISPT